MPWHFRRNSRFFLRLLERLLDVTVPHAFARFLCELGGGGVEGAEITGIDGSARTEGFGTVYGDTKRLREEFGLSRHLVALRVDDEEFAWCLDCSPTGGG